MQTTHVTPPEAGALVFSSDGDEIGEITEVQPDYFHVKKGLIFRKDLYIPVSAIVGTALGGDGVQVNLTKEQLESGDWSERPATVETDGGAESGTAEHNTMGISTPREGTGETAPMASGRLRTPSGGADETAEDRPDVGIRPDDTDVSQRPETERHYSPDDETNRP